MSRQIVLLFDGPAAPLSDRIPFSHIDRLLRLVQQAPQGPDGPTLVWHDAGPAHWPATIPSGVPGLLERQRQRWRRAAAEEDPVARMARAYRFLVTNWRPGDEVFCFAQGSGSLSAQALHVLLHNHGLLRPEHEDQVDMMMAVLLGGESSAEEQATWDVLMDTMIWARSHPGAFISRGTQAGSLRFLGLWGNLHAGRAERLPLGYPAWPGHHWRQWLGRTLRGLWNAPVPCTMVRVAAALDEHRHALRPASADDAWQEDFWLVKTQSMMKELLRVTPHLSQDRFLSQSLWVPSGRWFAADLVELGGGAEGSWNHLPTRARAPFAWMLSEATLVGLRWGVPDGLDKAGLRQWLDDPASPDRAEDLEGSDDSVHSALVATPWWALIGLSRRVDGVEDHDRKDTVALGPPPATSLPSPWHRGWPPAVTAFTVAALAVVALCMTAISGVLGPAPAAAGQTAWPAGTAMALWQTGLSHPAAWWTQAQAWAQRDWVGALALDLPLMAALALAMCPTVARAFVMHALTTWIRGPSPVWLRALGWTVPAYLAVDLSENVVTALTLLAVQAAGPVAQAPWWSLIPQVVLGGVALLKFALVGVVVGLAVSRPWRERVLGWHRR